MDPFFILLCLFPIVVGAIQFVLYRETFSLREFGVQVALCTLLVVATWNLGRFSNASDTMIRNGSIDVREAVRKDCPWGWVRSKDDFCTEYRTRSVQTGETCTSATEDIPSVCTPTYTTEYSYDYDWEQRYFVEATMIGLKYEFDRIDPQGVRIPPAFLASSLGDPASKAVGYMNWVKGASNSLYHQDGKIEDKYAESIPAYPGLIYDGYKADRVVIVGEVPVDAREWSLELSRSLSVLGPAKDLNAIVVLVGDEKIEADFAFAVQRAWQGFKKNDAVVFIGLGADMTVRWSKVLSWSAKSGFDLGLAFDIQALEGPLTSEFLNATLVAYGTGQYEARSMEEFEFLKESIPVPVWLYLLVALLGIGGTAGLSYVFHRTDF